MNATRWPSAGLAITGRPIRRGWSRSVTRSIRLTAAGYARAALEALLQRAAREPRVRTVRVTISPDNVASYQLAAQYGFTKIGEQWDAEDGLEIIYEVDA